MRVEMRSIKDIRPYAANPRKNEAAVAAVAASIKEFGWRQPIVVDKEGVIVVGDTRFKAAQLLGLEQIPVHVATGLSPEQLRAYRLADNKTGELATWNNELLAQELLELHKSEFDVNLLGFSADELQKFIDIGGVGVVLYNAITGARHVPVEAAERAGPRRPRPRRRCWRRWT